MMVLRLVIAALCSMAACMAACAPGPAPQRGPLVPRGNSPGQGGAPGARTDDVGDRDGSAGGYRGIQPVKPGTPYLCKRELHEEHEVMRELEFGIGKAGIRRCYESYLRSPGAKLTDRGVLRLTVIIDRGGKIVDARASSFDYWLEDCVERAVTLNCIGRIIGLDGQPVRREFSLEMYLQR